MAEAVGGEVERVDGDDGVLIVVGFVGGERGRNVLVVMVVVGLVVVVGTDELVELVEEAIVVDLGLCWGLGLGLGLGFGCVGVKV